MRETLSKKWWKFIKYQFRKYSQIFMIHELFAIFINSHSYHGFISELEKIHCKFSWFFMNFREVSRICSQKFKKTEKTFPRQCMHVINEYNSKQSHSLCPVESNSCIRLCLWSTIKGRDRQRNLCSVDSWWSWKLRHL